MDNGDPPGPTITELYSAANDYGSCDAVEIVGTNRDDIRATYTASNGLVILHTQNKINGKGILTLPGGRITILPQHGQYLITFATNAGQSWQVAIDHAGQYVTPNGAAIWAQAILALQSGSSATISSMRNFLLTENLIVQYPDGTFGPNRAEMFNWAACTGAFIALLVATAGAFSCAFGDPFCPFFIIAYVMALNDYYDKCDPGHKDPPA